MVGRLKPQPTRNERRRLASILKDEEYGPKLARLRGAAERRVLDLVEQGRGREARKQILFEDELRRKKNRSKARERSKAQRAPTVDEVVAHFLKELPSANLTTITENVRSMSPEQRRYTMRIGAEQIQELAREGLVPWFYRGG